MGAGLAATTSVTLAACYGGPPVYGVDHGGPARWSIDASPGEFIPAFAARARGASCEVLEKPGFAIVKCAAPPAELRLREAGSHKVHVQCEDGSDPANCAAAFDAIRSAPPVGAPSSGPSTIAPPEAAP